MKRDDQAIILDNKKSKACILDFSPMIEEAKIPGYHAQPPNLDSGHPKLDT
jgi:hypothetical protein